MKKSMHGMTFAQLFVTPDGFFKVYPMRT